MTHREERTFEITLHLRAEFPEEYDGDDDGFVWHERFRQAVRPRLETAVFDALRADPRFSAVASPRGRDPESALDVDFIFKPTSSSTK